MVSVITIASPELLSCPWPKQLWKNKKKSKSVVRLVVLRAAHTHTDCFLDQGRELKEWKLLCRVWLQRKNQQPCLEEEDEGGREKELIKPLFKIHTLVSLNTEQQRERKGEGERESV